VIKSLREDNVREGFLEADKYQLILNELSEEIKPVFVVACHLGMRTSELLAIKRSWVDFSEELIHVNGRVTKNRASKTAPIYGQMKPWLDKLLSQGEQESPKCVWLFSRDGKPIKSFRADWARACEAAGVPGLLFHDLRRTAVRNMIRAGVPEKVAMQISGHKTASMLWRYNITDTRDIKEAGKRTGSYLKSERKEQHAEKPTEYFGAKAS
jgi:integrase